jgi:quercetin dioxygenase-like cupin family protein
VKRAGSDGTLRCSFCHKSEDVVGKLISSPNDYPRAYICDECIAVCNSILEDDRHDQPHGAPHKPPEASLSFIDTSGLEVIERLPGWRGRYFHSPSMTFAHYEFTRGATIHEHSHPQEEVYEVIDGELELTIDGQSQVVRPGLAAIVPPNVWHSVKALTDGHAIIVDSPRRPEMAHSPHVPK